MPVDLFQKFSPDEIQSQVKKIKNEGRRDMKASYDLAVDYMNCKMIDDVRHLLLDRFPSSQHGNTGQMIQPMAIPLTERYIVEAANTYDKSVKRTLSWPDGSTDKTTEEETDNLNRELDGILYDEVMHKNEQLTELLKCDAVWYQWDSLLGELDPQIILPQNIYPVAPDDGHHINPSKPAHYLGYNVELFWGDEDINQAQERTFAFVSRGQTFFYKGEPDKIDKSLGEPHPNPFTWMQVPEGEYNTRPGNEKELPLMPLTFWHRDRQFDQLIPDHDVDIVHANREINVALSVLFDTIRFQGFDTPVKKVNNPNDPKARQRHGARFPVVLEINEAFEYMHSAVTYNEQVEVLIKFVKLMAMLKRMSPNDFSVEGQKATSGFAKVVDSLPKIEARSKRLRRQKHTEEKVAWPRICSILTWAGRLGPKARQMKLNVSFEDLTFPKTPQETKTEIETNLKHDLTTRAKIIAERENISVEEAEEVLAQNKEANQQAREEEMRQQQAQFGGNGPGFGGFGLGNRIGRRKKEERGKDGNRDDKRKRGDQEGREDEQEGDDE